MTTSAYYAAHREEILASRREKKVIYDTARYAARRGPARVRTRQDPVAYQAKYKKDHHEELVVANAAYYVKNREKIAAAQVIYQADFRAANPERVAAVKAKWRAANSEKIVASSAAYRAAHCKEKASSNAAYWAANPEKVAAHNATRRAAILGNSIGYPKPDRAAILAESDLICYLCGDEQTPIDLSAKWPAPNSLTWEHILALHNDGPEATENIVPAHARCNSIKGKKILTVALREWIPVRKAQLDLRDTKILVAA